jgi:hypothetical protein
MGEQEQRSSFPSEISKDMIHQGYSPNSTHHESSFDGDDDKAVQGLQD